LILGDWICETHCAEIKMEWDADCHSYVFQMLGVSPDSMGAKEGHAKWMATCQRCPYLHF